MFHAKLDKLMDGVATDRAIEAALASVSAERIMTRLHQLAEIGGLPGGGVSRLGLTDLEQQARDRVAGWLGRLGYVHRQDDALNIFCTLADGARVLIGSHLDSVPQGGRFDGVLGVVAAVEAAEAAHAAGLTLPVEIAAWTDEEGARFGTGLFGSAAAFGRLPAGAWERLDNHGVSARNAAAALLGREPDPKSCLRRPGDLRAYLELHIEQGPKLAQQGLPVGIVSQIVGLSHATVQVSGRADHAGTTPMDAREDALAAAAECILAVEGIARESLGEVVGTVGEITISPGAKNVVPGTCVFSLDMRSARDDLRRDAVRRAGQAIQEVGHKRGVKIAIDIFNDVPAAAMSPDVIESLEGAARRLTLSPARLPSGAGHDAQNAAAAGVPTGMVFVRSTGGSHNPGEHATGEDAAAGTRMLLLAAIALTA